MAVKTVAICIMNQHFFTKTRECTGYHIVLFWSARCPLQVQTVDGINVKMIL